VPSRVSLSLLAFFTGAGLAYVFITFFNIPVHTEHTPFTRIGVLLAVALVVIGWFRIFRRRPRPLAAPR
jgi:hypothetical protein